MCEPVEKIEGTDYELCEFEDQCESCLHYGAVYFGDKDYWDSREGHYHCESCVRSRIESPELFVVDDAIED